MKCKLCGAVPANGSAYCTRCRRKRHRQIERKKERIRRKKRRRLLVIFMLLLIIAGPSYLLYQNSYTGMVNRANQRLEEGSHSQAARLFRRAINRNSRRAEAYIGLSRVHIARNELDEAENVFLEAIYEHPTSIEIYRAAIHFYLATDQPDKIMVLMDECNDQGVLSALHEYLADRPEPSLRSGTYNEVREVSFSIETEGEIFYTLDDSEPTANSPRHSEPIQLREGITIVRAISINAMGIRSLELRAMYTIEFPAGSAPAVSPSTGHYDQPMMISIRVPEGYAAYFTIDGSDPDPYSPATRRYVEEIEMPEGTTIFSAILIDSRGRKSEIAIRNYVLILGEQN